MNKQTIDRLHQQARTERAELLNKRAVAELLSLSVRSIDSLVKRNELPVVRLSKRCLRFPRQAVLDAMAARTIGVR